MEPLCVDILDKDTVGLLVRTQVLDDVVEPFSSIGTDGQGPDVINDHRLSAHDLVHGPAQGIIGTVRPHEHPDLLEGETHHRHPSLDHLLPQGFEEERLAGAGEELLFGTHRRSYRRRWCQTSWRRLRHDTNTWNHLVLLLRQFQGIVTVRKVAFSGNADLRGKG